MTNDGVEVKWLPLTDEYGIPIVPTGENYLPMLMDFGIWGYVTGLDYPRTGSRPGTTGGCRPQTGGWLTQIGPASSGTWSLAGATATRTIPDASISTISRRMGRSMRTRIPASGVWRRLPVSGPLGRRGHPHERQLPGADRPLRRISPYPAGS